MLTYKLSLAEVPEWLKKCSRVQKEPLPNFKWVEPYEFWFNFNHFTPLLKLFDQRYIEGDRFETIIAFMYEGDVCYGYVTRSEHSLTVPPTEYFKFGECDHQFVTEHLGNCWRRPPGWLWCGLHENTCTKCGYRYTVDSSD